MLNFIIMGQHSSLDYLRMLADEIRVNGNGMNITGNKVVLIERLAEMKKGTESVPSFIV